MNRQENIRNILIVKPSSLGDILHVFPVLELLKKHFPDATVDFLINPEFAPLLDLSPVEIRNRIFFERKKLAAISTFPRAFFTLFKNLRKGKYDLVIDFQGLLRSAIVSRLSGFSIPVAGFAAPREKTALPFYSEKHPVSAVHAVEKNVELFNRIFNRNEKVPRVSVPVKAPEFAQNLPDRYVLLIPGARWQSKCFPTTLFAQIANRLFEQDRRLQFFISGSSSECSITAEVRSALAPAIPVRDLSGKTALPELFELIRHAVCVICNDSGPMHIAALLDTPVFSFFGPTSPEKTGPWNQGERVIQNNTECSGCMNRICPLPETRCHKIDPEKTADIIFKFLQERDSSSC